jgi:hypothetical protein
VFPRWQAGAAVSLSEVPKAQAFLQTATNAFNYEMLGEAAFTTVRDIVAASRCLNLVYSELDSVVEALDCMASDVRG